MGHYLARKGTLDMLKDHLQVRADALAVEYDIDFDLPPIPVKGWRLTDVLPDDDINPRVMVSSSDGKTVRADSSLATATVTREYDLTIGTSCFESRDTGVNAEQASITRDIYTDAIVQCLRANRRISDKAVIKVSESGQSETGPSELLDRMKRQMSVGAVAAVVSQEERITPTAVEIETTSHTVTPIDDEE